ncbi:NifB/NifX family molybdenum-iron cluster-binding protein [Fundidesulfovibrio soli]|uniref:NifB/NifX family molybdenum-iron cluster-binding protein n=1 Tax=Fundidesulfovibrio soli TaxID=2922716 RepID=UPI001FAF08E4|nr:dinitrogenase iron-molybdenum cofactor biosynthesis protein [Fundidesulfovibrio soli]
MRSKRVLIPLFRDEVAPRFDLASAALIAMVTPGEENIPTTDFLLPQPSAEGVCDLVLQKDVDVVICGAIEEEYYHYLRWKRVEVLDNVAAPARVALERFAKGALRAGDILFAKGGTDAR